MKNTIFVLFLLMSVGNICSSDHKQQVEKILEQQKKALKEIEQKVKKAIEDGADSQLSHIVHRAMFCGPALLKEVLEKNVAGARSKVNEPLRSISPTLGLCLAEPEYGEISEEDRGGEGKDLTPLMMIRFYEGHERGFGDAEDEVQILLQHEVALNAQDKNGNTALHHLALRRKKYLERRLVEMGARNDILNKSGLTADQLHEKQCSGWNSCVLRNVSKELQEKLDLPSECKTQ